MKSDDNLGSPADDSSKAVETYAVVSIVIPTLREHAFGDALDEVLAYLRTVPEHAFDIVVVDDSDAVTQARMNDAIALRRVSLPERIGVRFVAGPHLGKGAAVRLGAQTAVGDVVFVVDADLPIPLRYMTEFLETMRATGADIVIGERSRARYADSPIRQVLSGGLRVIQKSLVFGNARFEDTQCGFKAFRASAFRDIVARQLVDRGMYDLEYLYAATQRRLRIEAVSVAQNPEVRPTRINLLSCLVFDPLDIVRFKVSGAFGRYK
jgi:glycosyltransferase involved in cell wall biosynthesis